MQLHHLISNLTATIVSGPHQVDVPSLAYDSRKVTDGSAFFCIENNRKDGHAFAADAVSRGARVVFVDHLLELPPDITQVQVPNVGQALALAASTFYGNPSHQMLMVGVTGTNGKTTTTWLIEALLQAGGKNPGMLGTVAVKIGGQLETAHNTTPLSLDLQEILGKMRAAGHDSVAMEVSSHGLALDRVYGIPYDIAVFTNLTQDHLDFHGGMEEYFLAKRLLFERLGQPNPKTFPRGAVVNIDDAHASRLLDASTVPHLTYGVNNPADVRASNIVSTFSGTRYDVVTATASFPIEMRLAGMFNVYNSLAAIATALAAGMTPVQIQTAMKTIPPVRGRFELVDEKQSFAVVVDYAHTPDGLENILRAARPMTTGKLIAVFGCGGDRDKTKRPIMGRITAQHADRPIITSDNPRTEDPDSIVRDIEVGVKEITPHYEMIVDRQTAIEHALSTAQAGDTVVIAGKGHETYQIFKDRTIHFDDAEVARNFLRGRLTGVSS